MLRIDSLRLDLRASTSPELAEALRARIRDAVESRLGGALQAIAVAENNDPSEPCVFIDELRVACHVNAALDDARIVSMLAVSLASAVEHDHSTRRVFVDRTELMAALIAALVDGVAWQRWWFEAFEGLRPLSTSQALRTLICDASEPGVAALVRLTQATLLRTLAALDTSDAARVLVEMRARNATLKAPAATIWAVAVRHAEWPLERAALAAWVGAERERPGCTGAASIDAVCALTQLALAFRQRRMHWPAIVDVAALRALLQAVDAPTGWVGQIDRDDLERLCQTMTESASDGARAGGLVEAFELHRSDHGGAFVLWAVMHWLGWPNRWHVAALARAADPEAARRRACELVLYVSAHALADDAHVVRRDPALRAAMRLPEFEDIAPEAIGEAATAVGVDSRDQPPGQSMADRLMNALAERVPGCAGSSAPYLRRQLLAASASIAIDVARGSVTVTLSPAPLQVLLEVSGLARMSIDLPGATALCVNGEPYS